jgi:hypothetical protein
VKSSKEREGEENWPEAEEARRGARGGGVGVGAGSRRGEEQARSRRGAGPHPGEGREVSLQHVASRAGFGSRQAWERMEGRPWAEEEGVREWQRGGRGVAEGWQRGGSGSGSGSGRDRHTERLTEPTETHREAHRDTGRGSQAWLRSLVVLVVRLVGGRKQRLVVHVCVHHIHPHPHPRPRLALVLVHGLQLGGPPNPNTPQPNQTK